jgi:uncharacterized protein DUF4232
MIKLNSTARVLSGMACLAIAGMSAAGCSATANASPSGSGGSAPATTSNAQTSAVPAVTLPANNPPTSAAPANTAPAKAAPTKPAPPPASAAPAPASGASGTARCHTSDLSASYTVVFGSAAAGSISYNLRLTNTSMHQCTIYGYAGMLLLDANHKPLPTNVQRDSLVPKRLLRLNPGGSAAATARFSPDVHGVGDNPGQACQPTAHYTEVTPPDETTQLVTAVSPPTSVCERGTMALSAFVAGRTGPNQ